MNRRNFIWRFAAALGVARLLPAAPVDYKVSHVYGAAIMDDRPLVPMVYGTVDDAMLPEGPFWKQVIFEDGRGGVWEGWHWVNLQKESYDPAKHRTWEQLTSEVTIRGKWTGTGSRLAGRS